MRSFLAGAFFVSGCGPDYTYPANTVPQSIQDICLKENNLAVKARVAGKTVGALLSINDLLDAKGQIPRAVHEKMGQVMQAVTRVALSTDLAIDFCEVIVRDRKYLNELVILRSLDDTKRANADAIGIEESINRTVFRQGKYRPVGRGNGNFILKEVKLEDFLAEQIAQRVRLGFARESREDAEETSSRFVLIEGSFDASHGERVFRFSTLSLQEENPHKTMLDIFHTASGVLKDYGFTDYGAIEIQDYLNRQKLTLDKETVLNYQAKRITDQEILDRYLTESQSVRDAFKLFGVSPSATEAAAEKN
ncbi:MAG: hypothetical protein HYZ52_04555 [Candidatus Omnitrophica bacterium]|nr:hypothetical protein [Candidatus Omnitrophota bacterium]